MQARKATHGLDGQHRQDSPWKSQSEWQRIGINGESSSMVWSTLGSRTAKEQNRPAVINRQINVKLFVYIGDRQQGGGRWWVVDDVQSGLQVDSTWRRTVRGVHAQRRDVIQLARGHVATAAVLQPSLQNISQRSYDYLAIMPKLRSTYDGRVIYKTSYEERNTSVRCTCKIVRSSEIVFVIKLTIFQRVNLACCKSLSEVELYKLEIIFWNIVRYFVNRAPDRQIT